MRAHRVDLDEQADPARVATLSDFGRELTLLRGRAGLTVRAVARAAGVPVSTAGDYFSGRHLPLQSQQDLLLSILRACGEADPGRLTEWVRALNRARRQPGRRPASARAPYRGLARFEPEDAPWFFGREDVTEKLVRLAVDIPANDDGQSEPAGGVPLTVVGPSGSGKSSLLRAGLIPRLTSSPTGNGTVTVRGGPPRRAILIEPARYPVAELAVRLGRSAADGHESALSAEEIESRFYADPAGAAEIVEHYPADSLAIVVDQFEGIFTARCDEQQRQAFITIISALARQFIVVLALRADFYDHALRYPHLADALQQRQVVVPPMSADQVRRAVCEPARLDGLDVEDGLVEVLLRDLAPKARTSVPEGAAHEAGALPLLSHSLLVAWEHSRRGRLTVADYIASGGITQAIARTAESVYASLEEGQKDAAQRIFLRLVQVSDEAPVTRAPFALSDLDSELGTQADDLLDRFVDQRLISVGPETAQITHDALLTAWPRLQEWIKTGHEDLRMRRRIGQAAQAWLESGKDSAALLRGGLLTIAKDWAANRDNRDSLTATAREFLETALAAEKTRQMAERARTQRLRRLVGMLTVLAVATLGLAGYAFQQQHAATTARTAATTARNVAESRGIAIQAAQIRGQDVSLAALLSLAAYQITPTALARASLLESSATPAAARLADSSALVQSVALSPDRQVLAAAASDGALRLWNVSRPGTPVSFGAALHPDGSNPLYAATFSPNGRILAAAGQAGTITLWNVSSPRHPVRVGPRLAGPQNTVYSLAFSPSGALLAAGSADDTVRLWNVANLARPALLPALTGFTGFVQAVAFSPDGKALAAGSDDKTVRLWNVSNLSRPTRLGQTLTGPARAVLSVAFSPDGTTLAAGGEDHRIWLWSLARSGGPVRDGSPLPGATDWINALAFSPDGTSIAAASSDNTVRLWNLSTRQMAATLPLRQPVNSLAWDGTRHLISGDAGGTVRIWSVPAPVLLTGSPVNSVSYSRNGRLLAVGSQTLQLWNPVSREQVVNQQVHGTFVNCVAFSPRGILAAGYGNGMIQLWRVNGARLTDLGPPVRAVGTGTARSQYVESIAFTRRGTILATGGDDGTIRLWSVSNPARPRLLAREQDSRDLVYSLAFSRNGDTLAAASTDGLTRLWGTADPSSPARLGPPLRDQAGYAVSVAFSPDGKTLAVGYSDGTVRLWNADQPGRPQPVGHPLSGPSGYAYSLAFSPDGTTLAVGLTDHTIWLWNVAVPARRFLDATLTGPAQQVFSVAFSPNGAHLAAGSADGTVRLWDTSPHAAASAICATTGQPLTAQEWKSYIPELPYHRICPVT